MNEETQAKKTKGVSEATSKPAHVVRHGAIAASIWMRQSPSGYAYYDFSLSRSFKSISTAKEGYSTNYFERNREDLVKTIEGASAWIAAKANQSNKEAA